MELGAHYKLNNLIGILDMNRLGQRGETMLGWNGDAYAARARAFGWHAIEIDGHNLDEIARAYDEATRVTDAADADRRAHDQGQGRSPRSRTRTAGTARRCRRTWPTRAIKELGGVRNLVVQVQKPENLQPAERPAHAARPAAEVRQRLVGGDALRPMATRSRRSARRGQTSSRWTAR